MLRGRLVLALSKSIAASLAVATVDYWLRPLGPARLALDMLLYAGLVFVVRAIDPAEVRALMSLVRNVRGGAAS